MLQVTQQISRHLPNRLLGCTLFPPVIARSFPKVGLLLEGGRPCSHKASHSCILILIFTSLSPHRHLRFRLTRECSGNNVCHWRKMICCASRYTQASRKILSPQLQQSSHGNTISRRAPLSYCLQAVKYTKGGCTNTHAPPPPLGHVSRSQPDNAELFLGLANVNGTNKHQMLLVLVLQPVFFWKVPLSRYSSVIQICRYKAVDKVLGVKLQSALGKVLA